MSTTVQLIVKAIGWVPRPCDPRILQPQFASPVEARIYTDIGVRYSIAWLRCDGSCIIALLDLPKELAGRSLRCFCCTEREYESRTNIERRRITSIDVCVESHRDLTRTLQHVPEQPVQNDEDDDRTDATATKLLSAVAGNEAANQVSHIYPE